MDDLIKGKVKGLLLKSFSSDEIASILQIQKEDVEVISKELIKGGLSENSNDLYNELQKDLSKLVLTEMNKEGRDSGVVLNAIRLQVEIQEKKLGLMNKTRMGTSPEKISKDYIYERDEKMNEQFKKGKKIPEIAKEFGVSNLSVEQAIDRQSLDLPDELKTLSPTIIAETHFTGIDKATRLKVLQEAYKNNLTRKQVRDMMVSIKGEIRKQ